MKTVLTLRAATLALPLMLAPLSAFAAADYEFRPLTDTVKAGASTVELQLIDKRTNKPVPDAVIFTTRMDMAPENMEGMTTPVDVLPSTDPNVYAFKTTFTMAGSWRFRVAAKVQGEDETVQTDIVLKAGQ